MTLPHAELGLLRTDVMWHDYSAGERTAHGTRNAQLIVERKEIEFVFGNYLHVMYKTTIALAYVE
jgi:hypothetical protein